MKMAFVGVEFASDLAEQASGAIALVHRTWLTPRKKEVWWPPYKTSARFKKALSVGEEPIEDTWKLCYVQRIFFSYDNFDKANKKLKECEEFSDVQSSALEDVNQIKKRQRKRNSKYDDTNSEAEDSENENFRPPPKISVTKRLKSSNKSVTPQFTSSNFIEKDCSSQQVTRSDSVMSTCSTFTKTSDATDSSRQTVLPLDQTVTPLSLTTVPTNITTWSESLNTSYNNNQSGSSYKGSHSHTFDEQVFIEIKKIREQIKEMHGLFKQFCTPSGVPSLPDNFPIEFPLKTREDLQLLENYLSARENQHTVSLYLSTLGGDTTTTRTNRILKHVLTNELAKGFNFAGQKNRKEGFAKFHLKTVIIRAVQMKSPSSTETAIETAIKIWLKHASDRIKDKEKKNIDIDDNL